MQKLLGINTNYKTIKSEKVGVLTGIIYMAPYNLSGKMFALAHPLVVLLLVSIPQGAAQ